VDVKIGLLSIIDIYSGGGIKVFHGRKKVETITEKGKITSAF
jgi:hypothetical protein